MYCFLDCIYFSCQLLLSIIHFRGIYIREPYAAWCVLRVCMLWICEILVDVFCLAIYRYFIRLKHTSLLSIKLKSGIHSIYMCKHMMCIYICKLNVQYDIKHAHDIRTYYMYGLIGIKLSKCIQKMVLVLVSRTAFKP